MVSQVICYYYLIFLNEIESRRARAGKIDAQHSGSSSSMSNGGLLHLCGAPDLSRINRSFIFECLQTGASGQDKQGQTE